MKTPIVANSAEIPSPALLLLREAIEANLQRMLAIAGDAARLRPHVKTHKIPELVRRQLELGITRFKCATIAEAEMCAAAGAADVLLALQPVGPNTRRFLQLVRAFPSTRFSAVVDCPAVVRDLAEQQADGRALDLLVDLDIGQHRTGIEPGPEAMRLARLISSTPGVAFAGLHAYDGHLHDTDPQTRRSRCEAAFAPVTGLRHALKEQGIPVGRVVAGGTPTFPFHAEHSDVECSPGTCVLWDAGYGKTLPDLAFEPAAILLTRVISRPSSHRLCLDLGHKAVASEMPHPRVAFVNLPEATPVAHNEEHLVVETPHAGDWAVGDCVFAIPWHICPTVALHAEVWVVEGGMAVGRWGVPARARRLNF